VPGASKPGLISRNHSDDFFPWAVTASRLAYAQPKAHQVLQAEKN
jgi:hypothetical protein